MIIYKTLSCINFVNSSSSITYILLNSSLIYFWLCLKWTFILTVAVNTFTFLCIAIWYDAGCTQMKWYNAHEVTLRTVLEMLFMYLCPHWYGRHWNHREHHTRFSVCSEQKPFTAIHSRRTCRIHIWIDFCSLIFTDTSPYHDLI